MSSLYYIIFRTFAPTPDSGAKLETVLLEEGLEEEFTHFNRHDTSSALSAEPPPATVIVEEQTKTFSSFSATADLPAAVINVMTPPPPAQETGNRNKRFRTSPHPYKGEADFDNEVKQHYVTIFSKRE